MFDDETNTYYGIKVKFWFFYPGHNSTSTKNQALVHELRTNPKYSKLITRLFHLTELETPPFESILESDAIYPKLIEVCEALVTLTDATNTPEGLNKKQWVELLNKNPKIIKDASLIFINMFAIISNYYPKYKEPPSESKVKAFFMTLHKELNLDINKLKILSLNKNIIQILINTYFN